MKTRRPLEKPVLCDLSAPSWRRRGAVASKSVTHLTGLGVIVVGRARGPLPGVFRRWGGSPSAPFAISTPRPLRTRGEASPSDPLL